MKRRELILLAAGVLVGLLAGMVVVGTSDDLRTSLFGSASSDSQQSTDAKSKDLIYYLVDLPTAQAWLADKYPDYSDQLDQAVTTIASIPATAPNIPKGFVDAQNEVEAILPTLYAGLTNTTNLKEIKVASDSQITTCLGLDNDPYNPDSPALYVYIIVPASQAKQAGVPQDWPKLESPMENTLYWERLACYPAPETKDKN